MSDIFQNYWYGGEEETRWIFRNRVELKEVIGKWMKIW